MTRSQRLRARVEEFITGPGGRLEQIELIRECVDGGDMADMMSVARLFEDRYGGITYNYELKLPAAVALLTWGESGLNVIAETVRASPTSKNQSIGLQILAHVASGDGLSPAWTTGDAGVDHKVTAAVAGALSQSARAHLVDLVLSIDDDDVAFRVGSSLMQAQFSSTGATRELFAAVSKRWLAVSAVVLGEFDALIKLNPADEPAFQAFLTAHPQILDPLAIRVWPVPDLFGFKEPDFIVQRADGTYMVVEIECPAKSLVTTSPRLSAEVTHAEQQATDYRGFLMRKIADLGHHLPSFQEPDCLVVIGVERTLTVEQKQVLINANSNRRHLRIVGFDWLLDRAKAISQNMTQPSVQIIPLRVV